MFQQINQQTSVRSILDEHPDAVRVFLKYSVNVPSECFERILHTKLAVGDNICLTSDLDALVRDLRELIERRGDETVRGMKRPIRRSV